MELKNIINKTHSLIEAKEMNGKISQRAMSEMIGVKPRTYTEYTRGTNEPLAMKALLNMLNKLDDEDIIRVVRSWEEKNKS
ncbi:MAG: putative transcriptional regulator [Sulfurimonas sp.]|jgi:putative transcriptional regulator|uniref:helix-turn-helix domain-containing protein n=1 Tax=Sulfurimonas sp. TaxID=2022749 RepID=UPI0025E9E46E|nr:helix-turn-helix domain-containing protein [Sulfurimonas sp.]